MPRPGAWDTSGTSSATRISSSPGANTPSHKAQGTRADLHGRLARHEAAPYVSYGTGSRTRSRLGEPVEVKRTIPDRAAGCIEKPERLLKDDGRRRGARS